VFGLSAEVHYLIWASPPVTVTCTLQMSGAGQGVSAFPDGDNLFTWIATINGGVDTMYDGLCYKLLLQFPSRYPYVPPTVKFSTPCFHPNVDEHGNICLDILKVSLFTCTVVAGY